MKRHGHLFESVASFDNLLLASEKALRGQKRKPAAARFFFNLEGELLQLQEELLTGTYQPRPYHVFEIFEPKRRREAAYIAGEIDEDELARTVSSMVGHILHAATLEARRNFFAGSMGLG